MSKQICVDVETDGKRKTNVWTRFDFGGQTRICLTTQELLRLSGFYPFLTTSLSLSVSLPLPLSFPRFPSLEGDPVQGRDKPEAAFFVLGGDRRMTA